MRAHSRIAAKATQQKRSGTKGETGYTSYGIASTSSVRALGTTQRCAHTHSAFKVALLMFCRERNLPHPGFIILDTPLLTYRDPLRAKAGPLTPDEKELRNTSLKDFFFEHLSEVSKLGQIIVVENVDLPSNIEALGNVETFTGDPTNGRFGLFPRALDPSRA